MELFGAASGPPLRVAQASLYVDLTMSQSDKGDSLSQQGRFRTLSRNEIDWPGIRAAAVALNSVRLAAIKASAHLPPDEQRRFVERVNKRAYRERWLDKAKALSKPRDNGSLRLSKPVQSGADAVAQTLAERRQESIVHLSKYAVDAGKRLANSGGDLNNTRALRRITSGHASLFPEDQPHTKIDVRVLNYEAIRPVEASE